MLVDILMLYTLTYKILLYITLFLQELSGLLYFVIGAIAKTVATIVTYPLQVIQSKSRVCTVFLITQMY